MVVESIGEEELSLFVECGEGGQPCSAFAFVVHVNGKGLESARAAAVLSHTVSLVVKGLRDLLEGAGLSIAIACGRREVGER
eukprot:scaffold23661_cov113-Isochrysis_galbana.AAC.8